uniref:Ig-like domain-containing protein n=1 Tax=Gadus morhua TaxID=8049 RepID=A0A8C5BN11_GADMO
IPNSRSVHLLALTVPGTQLQPSTRLEEIPLEGDLFDKEKQQKPQFKKKLTSVRMKRFGPAHFECRLTPIGDPTMVVEWLHDGKPLDAANRLRMVNEFGYCSLDYEVAYPRDSGVITCRATNKFGVDQNSATLVVKDEKGLVEESQLPEGIKGAHRIDEMERMAHEGGPTGISADDETEKSKPCIVLVPEPAVIVEGETARFRCRVTGYPTPKVNWYLNGQLIRKSKRYRLRYDGIYYLEIVDRTFEGEYSCTVCNRFGQSNWSSYLHVHLKDLVGYEKEALFRYKVTGSPLPEVQWLRGSYRIKPSQFCIIVNNSDGSGLMQIKSIKQEDSDIYTCKASNHFGEALCSAELEVFREAVQQEQRTVIQERGYKVTMTEKATESCLYPVSLLGQEISSCVWLPGAVCFTYQRNICPDSEAGGTEVL